MENINDQSINETDLPANSYIYNSNLAEVRANTDLEAQK